MAKCDCSMWRDNIDKVNEPLMFLSTRNPGQWDYKGAPFLYCPWCSSPLYTRASDAATPAFCMHEQYMFKDGVCQRCNPPPVPDETLL